MRLSFLVLLMFSYLFTVQSQTSALREPIQKLSSDLEAHYQGRQGIKIALLEFRTTDDRLLPFNAFIRDEMVLNYQVSEKFKLIDPFMTAKVAAQNNWSMKTVSSFPYYEKLGQQFMEKTGYVPDAWIYGQIQDNEESITLTAYYVPTGTTDAKLVSTVSFPSDEQSDRLLGKPIKIRTKPSPPPDTLVIEHRVVIEETVIEPVTQPAPEQLPVENSQTALPSVDYEQFHFELTEVSFIGEKLHIRFSVINKSDLEKKLYITSYNSRIIDNEGGETLKPEVSLGSTQSSYSVNKNMVPGVAIKGEVVFEKFPDHLTIKLLELGVQDEKISFRDLPVNR